MTGSTGTSWARKVLEILQLPIVASIQDAGRPGFLRFGVPKGGAMDPFALAEGFALLGSDSALEFAGPGGRLKACEPVAFACTGGEARCQVNGRAYPWRSICTLERGDVLELGACHDGVYGYLHLAGGIDCPSVLGSKSTHLSSGIGWCPEPGSLLRPAKRDSRPVAAKLPRPDYLDTRQLRIVDAPQSGLFSERDRQVLTEVEFTISASRNRMGIALEMDGSGFLNESGRRIASDAIMQGDIQIAADGSATVLMADAQSMGGYPRIATVVSADLPALAQAPSGSRIRFERISHDAAEQSLLAFRKSIIQLSDLVSSKPQGTLDDRDLLAADLISGVVRGDEEHEH